MRNLCLAGCRETNRFQNRENQNSITQEVGDAFI
jgi:hypothetical protein